MNIPTGFMTSRLSGDDLDGESFRDGHLFDRFFSAHWRSRVVGRGDGGLQAAQLAPQMPEPAMLPQHRKMSSNVAYLFPPRVYQLLNSIKWRTRANASRMFLRPADL